MATPKEIPPLSPIAKTKHHNHSHLDRNRFNTQVNDKAIDMSFFTYYTSLSPIYYELTPFVKMLKFVKDKDREILNSIPRAWVKHAEDFNDDKFAKCNVLPETLFGEVNAIYYVISCSDSKNRIDYVEKISSMCIRKIDSTRTQRLHEKHANLDKHCAELKVKQEQHATSLDLIRDALTIVMDHHSGIQQIIRKLYEKL